MNQNLSLFLFGLIFAPVAILLHECGHYLTAKSLGLTATFHIADVTLPPQPNLTMRSALLVGAGGPMVDLLSAIGGFLWLRHLRHDHPQQKTTPLEWLATFFALAAGRWLRCLASTAAHPQPADESHISQALGLPLRLLPYLLLPIAIILLTLTIRQHPRGARLYPLTSAILGLALGAFLWVKIIAPHIVG